MPMPMPISNPITLLLIMLLLASIGMALVVLGTVHGALFMPGVILLALGLFGSAGAGIWRAIQAR